MASSSRQREQMHEFLNKQVKEQYKRDQISTRGDANEGNVVEKMKKKAAVNCGEDEVHAMAAVDYVSKKP
ncbi:hypothetical protein E3N88_29421 [Mikania micrantha]|uniref:Uncharacterized protein n=1 Tax=Mikania micrantha TaxID=192012 RepID=A0A5N6MJD6_9ASTR|nr:hypothetical protein E3N88_29421 [Mikania micrantha]